jgi:putative ABC transport system substrate-binding protein
MQFAQVKRREFITLLSGVAASWPFVARAQQPALPVIGFLRSTSLTNAAHLVAAFHRGLKEIGYIDWHNVAVEFQLKQRRCCTPGQRQRCSLAPTR